MTTPTMLDLRGVSKTFDSGQPVLVDIDLEIDSGEIVCLLGPSGCGKTTLLRMIAGLETPDRGRIFCQGTDLADVPVHKRNFGFMFQDFALFPHRTVGENIEFGLRMEGRSRSEIVAQVSAMLELIGLPAHFASRSIFDLSGGERQRVALARSLAPNPRLLMLDEPLGNLDRGLRERLMVDVRSILKRVGMTAVYVTHDQEEAYAVADRIVILNAGYIVQNDTPQAVYTRPADTFVAKFLGLDNLLPVVVSPDGASLSSPLGLLPVPTHAGGLVPGERYILLIHPEAATIAQAGTPGSIQAWLKSLSFRGDHFEIECTIPHAGADGADEARHSSRAEVPRTSEDLILLRLHLTTYDVVGGAGIQLASGREIRIQLDMNRTSFLPPTQSALEP